MNKKLLFGFVFLVLLYSVSATTINISIGNTYGSATERSDNLFFSLGVDSTPLIWGRSGAAGNPFWYSGHVFESVTIPQGATITSAYMYWTASVSEASLNFAGNVYGNDVDNANDFNTEADLTGRTKTTANISYTTPTSTTVDVVYQSVDISAIVQEIVNRGGWVSGNNLGLIFEATSGTAGKDVNTYYYATSTTKTPRLVVEYTTPLSPFFDVTATDAADDSTLYNITVTLGNGSVYTNVSNAIVTLPINDSSVQNITVEVDNYFTQTFTNYNTSVDLQANMTQYPYIAAYNPYDNASIQTFNVSYTYGGASYCYQETANVSTACGGLATGTYATNGTWVSSTYNTYDGDWTTYSNGFYPQNNVNLFINYSKPSAWIGAPYWQVKTEDGTPTKTTQNITLTAACYTDSIIQLRIQKIAGQTIKFLCYNGSTWYQLDQSANSADSYVYEEAMIWRLPTTQVTNYKEYVALNDTYTVTMSKSGYFSKTLTHDFTNSTDLNATLVQAQVRFNASQIITGTYLSAANFTINGVTKGSGEAFYLDADTYNVQFSASGYYAKNASVVVSALQNNTVTVSGVSSSAIHINATNILNTTPILNFDIVITNDYYGYVDNYSTVSGGVDVSILANTPFNITINATGYALANTTIITNYTLYNYTFNLYTAESILFTIYDEISQEQINGTNFTIAIIGTYQALNRTTSNGTLYVDLLTPDDYEIRYYSTNSNDYALRTLFVTVSKQSFQAIDLYTLNGSTTSATIADVKFIVYDQNLQPLENALVTVKRYYINQNGYLSVYSRYTNTAGEVLGQFEATDAFYQYTVTYNNVVIYSSSAVGTQFYDGQIIPIYVDTTGAFSTELSEILAVTSSLVFTSTSNTTGYFTYTYSSASVVQACLRLNTFSSGGSVNNESCQSPTTSGTIVVAVDSNNAVKTYTALAYIRTSSSSDYWLDKQLTVSLNYGSPLVSSEAWRDNILFGAILILLMSGLLYIRFPAVAILVQTIIMVMLAAPPLYLLPILPVTLGWIIALALFLLISTRRRGVQ